MGILFTDSHTQTDMYKYAVLAALVACAVASHFHHHGHHEHKKLECTKNGQFLPNGYDECTYIRCDYGDEPWYDEHGNIKFVPVVQPCAPGTVTDFYHFDYQNPCSIIADHCHHHHHPHAAYHPHPHAQHYPAHHY